MLLAGLRLPPLQRHSRARMLLDTTPAPVQRHSRTRMLLKTAPAPGAKTQQYADAPGDYACTWCRDPAECGWLSLSPAIRRSPPAAQAVCPFLVSHNYDPGAPRCSMVLHGGGMWGAEALAVLAALTTGKKPSQLCAPVWHAQGAHLGR